MSMHRTVSYQLPHRSLELTLVPCGVTAPTVTIAATPVHQLLVAATPNQQLLVAVAMVAVFIAMSALPACVAAATVIATANLTALPLAWASPRLGFSLHGHVHRKLWRHGHDELCR
jgi:hypothetical protein